MIQHNAFSFIFLSGGAITRNILKRSTVTNLQEWTVLTKTYSMSTQTMIQESIQITNEDNMELMSRYQDNHFDLAIVDPPYGIETRGNAQDRFRGNSDLALVNDAKPNDEYFDELMRVSKNQIIWGYNHLSDMLPKCREFIFWYKRQPVITFSDGELAWTSFQKTARCFDYSFHKANQANKGDKIHPTQKPIALYQWIFNTYANVGDKILDTHIGSGSIAIALDSVNKVEKNATNISRLRNRQISI